MKKTILYIFLVGVVLLIAAFGYKNRRYIRNIVRTISTAEAKNTILKNTTEPVLASFSFHSMENTVITDSMLHYTVKLHNIQKWDQTKEEIEQIPDEMSILLTVEIWGNNNFFTYISNPLEEVLRGNFDEQLKVLCNELIANRQNVYIRFNPEMEVPVTRFPWQYRGWTEYMDAFRHFAGIIKICSPQAKVVWGPAGYPGTMEYYPGDDVVDAVSVTLKSESEMPLEAYPKNYTVEYDLFRRLHRLRFTNKPVFILGSPNSANDSVNQPLITNLNHLFINERDVVYSEENFKRHEFKTEGKTGLPEGFEIGLYDPQSWLIEDEAVSVEHLFIDFGNLNDGTFQTNFEEAVKRGHNVILTFEPFRNPNGETDLKVLEHVTEGMYDKEINQFYSIILTTNRKIYLRYAHEMEIPITRYPWQSQNPVTYIKSFRYFMNFKETLPENVKRVWGPAGDRGSIEWWPGNDVVDFISIAIYGLPDKNITDPEKQESFETIFNRKYWRFRFVDKPFFITEFGVKGPEEYQTKWLEAAAKVIRKNPQIKGINYFNMSDTPLAWGEIKPPDWSITKESFHRFLEVLKEE
jgi:beta-mannanase